MSLKYVSGFGSFVETEAVAGAQPRGRNSPQKPPFGLYAEQFSATAFTAPRSENRHTWLYRLRPSAAHAAFVPCDEDRAPLTRTAPFHESKPNPNRLRWDPLPLPDHAQNLIDGLITIAGNGDATQHSGIAAHQYLITAPMKNTAFMNADGEFLFVPQSGAVVLRTELGVMELAPGEIGVVPRGIKFTLDPVEGSARGYVCENYGALFRLPELGPIGANGLANARDFLTPVAAFEDRDEEFLLIQKYQGYFWQTMLSHSPFDVVAWHGNLAPYKYDLKNFNTIGTVSFDHPDPSIFTVLTSPTDTVGTANCDFVIFPPRWMVAEDTFRPPWFHRNIMSEFMGLIYGAYDAKAAGFAPGGMSLHNGMSAHGPDAATHKAASNVELAPHKIDGTMAFMFESRLAFNATAFAMETPSLQADYDSSWAGFVKARLP